MIITTFTSITPSSEITVNLKAVITSAEELTPYENKECFEALCKAGCPNYNSKWACPPYSPSYSEYKKDFSKALLVLFYCHLNQFHYTRAEYMKVKASNAVLKSRMDRLMRVLEAKYAGRTLSNGSCRLCKPCNLKKNRGCKRPTEMRYSLESLGLNVVQICKDHLDHTLLWYVNRKAPRYSSVVSCVLTNSDLSEAEMTIESEISTLG